MAQLGRLGFLGIAVVFHLIYIYSIFDIYFVSPIVHGMRPHRINAPAPAKRLFLIVGDGLRADKCFQSHPNPFSSAPDAEEMYLSPFLRNKINNEATFGVSHTRVPTESRPGHVALIAGLYEDVSAVTTGWKHNPVDFDSVFNESRHTWSWGSPDILPMFKDGASDPSRVDAYTYGHEFEDFTQDATLLDLWVFDRVEQLFENARHNSTLKEMLMQDKIVFFLHLLGLDTTGHSYRPYSKEYLRNIKIVDDGVARINKIANEFYRNDGKTAWIFTADHGMSDWGSHGDGHPDNTRTPLVAWGAGVRKPVKGLGVMPGHEDGLDSDWNLDHVRRVDVAQADIAALMAYLIGVPFPVNSVGELPLEYLDATPAVKAEAIFTNALQILEQYRVKENQKRATVLNFKPFPLLDSESLNSLEARSMDIRGYMDVGNYEVAIAKSLELIKVGLEGLRYLQTYDWLFLRTLVTLGYLGWIVFSLTTVINLHVVPHTASPADSAKTSSPGVPTTKIVFASILVALYSMIYLQKSPWQYYLYALFPVFFWEEVFARGDSLAKGCGVLFKDVKGVSGWMGAMISAIGFVGALEVMVLGYFHREVFTACFLLATLWPLIYGTKFVTRFKGTVALWILCCASMSTFTLLPVVKVEEERQILLGGGLMFLLGLSYMIFGKVIIDPAARGASKDEGMDSKTLLGVQVGLIALAMYVTQSSVKSLQAKQGLPLGNQVVGWGVFVLSLIVPFFNALITASGSTHYSHRLAVLFLAFAPTFILLTISYEGLFYVAFCVTLAVWLRIEHLVFLSAATNSPTNNLETAISGPSSTTTLPDHRTLALPDTRLALFFLFLIQIAFFGTGNIASISSFSLDSVYRLVPIFNPFAMAALLLFKILVPFAMLSAVLGVLNQRVGPLAPSSLFMLVMAVVDVLTLNFFWLVRDEGSWLDIGTSISHYCIGAGLTVFVCALEVGSSVLVGGVDSSFDRPLAVEQEKKVEAEKAL